LKPLCTRENGGGIYDKYTLREEGVGEGQELRLGREGEGRRERVFSLS